jgi:hypothetical protein
MFVKYFFEGTFVILPYGVPPGCLLFFARGNDQAQPDQKTAQHEE